MFLQGNHVTLEALDVETIFRDVAGWLNDADVTKFMFYGQRPMTELQVKEMLEAQVANSANAVFAVRRVSPSLGKLIGFAGLYDIHPTAHKAEFRVLIGAKSAWGQGIGTEVTEILTRYGFDRLNLHRLWLGVTSENMGAVRAYEKAGYVREGVLKDDIWRNGRYYDTIRMAVVRETPTE